MNAVAFRLLFPDPRDRVRDSARVVARPVLSLLLTHTLSFSLDCSSSSYISKLCTTTMIATFARLNRSYIRRHVFTVTFTVLSMFTVNPNASLAGVSSMRKKRHCS